MKTKVMILRALAAVLVKKALKVVLIVAAVILLAFLILIWVLAINVSNWWWLLLLPLLVILSLVCLAVILINFLLRIVYPEKITGTQKQQLELFSTKVQNLLETRTMGWPLFLLICLKDLLLHKELRSLKQLLHDSTSLKRDFAKLEDAFTVRAG